MALTPHDAAKKFITKIELAPNEVYEIHDPAAVHELADLNLGGALLIFKGIEDTVAELPSTGNNVGDVRLVREDSGEYIWTDENKWELMDAHIVADHTHTVTHTTKNSTASASVLETAGSVTAGSDVVFNAGSHTPCTFEQGEDEFTFNPGSYTAPSLTETFVASTFEQGEDTFTPAELQNGFYTPGTAASFTQGTDTFDAGSASFTQGEDTFTAGNVTVDYTKQTLNCTPCEFEQGTDSFTPNVPTEIDVTKFNAGSASLTPGSHTNSVASFTQGTDTFIAGDLPSATFTHGDMPSFDISKFKAGSFNAGSCALAVEGETLKLNYVAPTHTAPSMEDGIFNPGTECSFTFDPGTECTFEQGEDIFNYTAGSHTDPVLNFTAPSLGTGFYKKGTAASFTQGIDNFEAGTCSITDGAVTVNYTKPTFVQGQDTFSYTAPSFNQGKDIFKANTPTVIDVTKFFGGSFEQGEDKLTAGSHNITFNPGSYTAPSATFKQGVDKFTACTYTAPTLTGGKATKVTLPTFSTVNNIWVGEKEETLTTSEAIEAAE